MDNGQKCVECGFRTHGKTYACDKCGHTVCAPCGKRMFRCKNCSRNGYYKEVK